MIPKHAGQVDVFDAVDDVLLDLWIALAKTRNERLNLRALRAFALPAARGHRAGAVQKGQAIVRRPRDHVALVHEVERTNEFHAGIVLGVQFRHHGLDLPAVDHRHQNSLRNIIKVVTERNFVAAERARLRI